MKIEEKDYLKAQETIRLYEKQREKEFWREELENLYRYHKGEATLLDFMVMAYNKALEDAVEIVGDRGDPEWSWRYQDWISSLKI